jgi:hypothetical protein
LVRSSLFWVCFCVGLPSDSIQLTCRLLIRWCFHSVAHQTKSVLQCADRCEQGFVLREIFGLWCHIGDWVCYGCMRFSSLNYYFRSLVHA